MIKPGLIKPGSIATVFRARTRTVAFPALLLITGTTALSTDTYIAALPEVQTSLGTTASVAQLTITACIVGMAIGQLFSGAISDGRGRRTMLVLATLVFTVMSALCAVSTSGATLIAYRAVQGIACGAGATIGRAVVTDTYRGREAAARFGTLSAVGLIAPVLGPAVGGVLLTFGSWRLVFAFLTAVGLAMTVSAVLAVPETLPPPARQPGGLSDLSRRARDLLGDRNFAIPVIVNCLTVGGFFVYIGGSSFVLQEGVGISQQRYTIVFAVNAFAMMTASVVFRLTVVRLGPVVLRRVAIIVQTVAVTALFVGTLLSSGDPPLTFIWACLSGMTTGLGLYLPATSAIVQQVGRRYAGTASSLGGGLPFLTGALTTPLTGLIGSQSVFTMATAMFVFFALAAVAALVWQRTTVADFGTAGAD